MFMDDQEFEGVDGLESEARQHASTPAGEQSVDETPIPEELAREEAKNLYGLMKKLASAISSSKDVYRPQEGNVFPADLYISPEFTAMEDNDSPFKSSELGNGSVGFTRDPSGQISGKDVGVDAEYILDIGLHMDKATEAQAKSIKWYPAFNTRFFFDKDGNYAVVAFLPKRRIESDQLIDIGPSDHFNFAKTPFTPAKAEFAGMALNYLMNRVKAENAPQ